MKTVIVGLWLVFSAFCHAADSGGTQDSSVHAAFVRLNPESDDVSAFRRINTRYAILPLVPQRHNPLTREVFGYFPYWFRSRWQQVDWQLISTVAYFSGEINADGSVGNVHGWPRYAGDPSASADVISIINAAHGSGVKVVLCFTNFTAKSIDTLVSTPACRETFFREAMAIVKAGNGDGINIDFESIPSGSKNNLTLFMRALADTFHAQLPGSQVSCAPTDYDTRAGDWDLAALYPFVDLFFFQGYGYGWSGTSTTRPVALLPNTSYYGSLNITTFMDYVLARIPAGKTLLGLPHYGYRWAAASGEPKASTQGTGVVTYYPDALGYVSMYGKLWDATSFNTWFRYQSGAQWYQGWYDGPESMSHKYQFVLDRALCGIGVWALGMDAGNHDIWDKVAEYFAGGTFAAVDPGDPAEMGLLQNYPNPFNPGTTIVFRVPGGGDGPGFPGSASSWVNLSVYDVLGREVSGLVDASMPAGIYSVAFDAKALAGGVYICRLQAGRFAIAKRMAVLK
jgi:spore germination protein YaaH